jgi:hypothetical protein
MSSSPYEPSFDGGQALLRMRAAGAVVSTTPRPRGRETLQSGMR